MAGAGEESWEWGAASSSWLPNGQSTQDRKAELSLSSGKGHPGLCPAGGGHPCSTHQAPSLPRDFIFTSVKCKKIKPSYRAWKFTGGPYWSADKWH